MRGLLIWFVVAAGAVGGAPPALSAETALFKPMSGFSIRSPVSPPPPGGPFPYASTGGQAPWGVVAWDIPGGDLSGFATARDGGDTVFTSSAPEASIVLRQPATGAATLALSQDGGVLPCLTAGGQPRESDLFFSPNTRENRFETNGYAETSHNDAVVMLRHLTILATVGYDAVPSRVQSGCGVAQGSVMVSVILSNATAHQTLFYQLGLATICGPQPAARLAFCGNARSHPHANFFFVENPFGVDDRLPLLGEPFLAPGGKAVGLHVDVLPRLLKFIASGPAGMDHDASHWTYGAFYAGQNIWGGVAMRTQWSSVQVLADRR